MKEVNVNVTRKWNKEARCSSAKWMRSKSAQMNPIECIQESQRKRGFAQYVGKCGTYKNEERKRRNALIDMSNLKFVA